MQSFIVLSLEFASVKFKKWHHHSPLNDTRYKGTEDKDVQYHKDTQDYADCHNPYFRLSVILLVDFMFSVVMLIAIAPTKKTSN